MRRSSPAPVSPPGGTAQPRHDAGAGRVLRSAKMVRFHCGTKGPAGLPTRLPVSRRPAPGISERIAGPPKSNLRSSPCHFRFSAARNTPAFQSRADPDATSVPTRQRGTSQVSDTPREIGGLFARPRQQDTDEHGHCPESLESSSPKAEMRIPVSMHGTNQSAPEGASPPPARGNAPGTSRPHTHRALKGHHSRTPLAGTGEPTPNSAPSGRGESRRPGSPGSRPGLVSSHYVRATIRRVGGQPFARFRGQFGCPSAS
mgnify:CR=1 FL=1|jgi:hypothetical protein